MAISTPSWARKARAKIIMPQADGSSVVWEFNVSGINAPMANTSGMNKVILHIDGAPLCYAETDTGTIDITPRDESNVIGNVLTTLDALVEK